MILVIILIFAFTAYATNENLGSPGKVYDLLVQAASSHPVDGNAEGSYLTMRSKEGAVFFVINIVGNFGTGMISDAKNLVLADAFRSAVFLDNGYWNKVNRLSQYVLMIFYFLLGDFRTALQSRHLCFGLKLCSPPNSLYYDINRAL